MRYLLIAVLAVAASAQTSAPKPNAALEYAGRFQLFFSPHARADVYLVDTATGKIWKPVTINNASDSNLKSAPQVWIYQDRIDSDKDFALWMAFHPPTETHTPTTLPATFNGFDKSEPSTSQAH